MKTTLCYYNCKKRIKAHKVGRSVTIFKTKLLGASRRRVSARLAAWGERNRYRESMNALDIDRTISDMDNDFENEYKFQWNFATQSTKFWMIEFCIEPPLNQVKFWVPKWLFISNTQRHIIKHFASLHKLKMPPIKKNSSGFKSHVVGKWKYQVSRKLHSFELSHVIRFSPASNRRVFMV